MDRRLYAAVTGGDVVALTKLINKRHEEIPSGGSTPLKMDRYYTPLSILHELTPGGNTALHLAAYYGHLQIVQMLLKLFTDDMELGNEESGQFVLAQNLQGNTALHEAVKGGHYQIVDALLRQSAELSSITNKAGETALFKAAEEGHEEIILKLLPLMSSQYDRRAHDGHTPLHVAVSHGHKDVVESLLDQTPDLLMQANNFGRTPLHSLAYVKKPSKIAKLLLEKDITLCYKVDRNHQSALHIAVIEGNVDLVKEILTYGRDCLEIVDNDGRNVLHLAAEKAVQIFEKISRHIKTLMLSIISKDLINDLDNHGKTPLDIVLEKMSHDQRLFSGMERLLKANGGRKTAKMEDKETLERPFATRKLGEKNQMISINAVLIATVAFQAAFTLPLTGQHKKWFVVFMLCDALAFCSAISTAVVLIYAIYDKQEDSLLVKTSLKGLWIALVALVAAFAVAVNIYVESEYRWVAEVVRVMGLGVPIAILVMILRSKNYIFSEDERYVRASVIGALLSMLVLIPFNGQLMSAIWATLAVVVFFLAVIFSTKTLEPISKHNGLWVNIFYSFWGRILCIVTSLGIVVLMWMLWKIE
ncbi:hypothetical protein SUGI_0972800 [Cryptomeria japonica]|uniref:ankyrin repeat-containing protein ITN1-like n=1 Tax=Cryptomeria japonica TaxID=3369 RepID=UPI0024146937|nr:ankyrin repeat-containing protein ITN1-like [Cryptomeria japonica]GLJ46183.1 hypothetical protein SUGI_0972800 [Cryptomeria japonica]